MSEIIETVETPTAETPTAETPTVEIASAIDEAIESVMALINEMDLFSKICRGALTTNNSLTCEPAPSISQEIYMDKNYYVPLTLALNGKHSNLKTLSNTLDYIADSLSRLTSYPSGNGFEIVDISRGNFAHVIGREQNNQWLAACDIVLKIYRKDNEQ